MRWFYLIILSLSVFSCKTEQKLIYFQGSFDAPKEFQTNYNPKIKSDDFLSILVSGDDPESVLPFNLNPVGMQQMTNNGYVNGMPAPFGYLVDQTGDITMPVIGKIRLGGLTRSEATVKISELLTNFVKNPVVQIQIQNYKVTVLGDVKNPGTFKVPNERITILEAIGLAGDLKITGNRKNILVIREENGLKTEYRIDLTNKSVFTSPVYYLTQNDVLYIEQNAAARFGSTLVQSTGGIVISMTSLILTTINILLY